MLAVPFADLAASSTGAPPDRTPSPPSTTCSSAPTRTRASRLDRTAEASELTIPRLGGLDPHSLTSSSSNEQAISTQPPNSTNRVPLLVPSPSRLSPRLLPSTGSPSPATSPTLATCSTKCLDATHPRARKKLIRSLRLMESEGIEPTVGTYTILIDGSPAARDISKSASEVFDECVGNEIQPNEHTYGALINGFCKIGQVEAVESANWLCGVCFRIQSTWHCYNSSN
uniref:Pentatricopeptide repeat-containing protein n=1 Tax=Oryza punctata TaxID=4537 RepID=A0A0E0LZ23_ORYPU